MKAKLKLDTSQKVKKWLRNIPFYKRNIELKTQFYKSLYSDFSSTSAFSKATEHYKKELDNLDNEMAQLLSDTKRLFSLLDEKERLVMTARYINLIRWDYIEFQTFFSRRQAIRVHDAAIEKLIGQEVFNPSVIEV